MICGIVQWPPGQLPLAQQLIAKGCTHRVPFRPGVWSKARLYCQALLETLMHWVLWWVHGCPPNLNAAKNFTMADLSEACRQAECPFLLADCLADPTVLDFIQQHAELVIALGQISLDPGRLILPTCGLVRVCHANADGADGSKQDVHIRIEHFARGLKTPCTIASSAVPWQPYDGLLGLTLKTDLIADDLLVETTRRLIHGSVKQAAEEVTEWMHRMFSPYLAQLQQPSLQTAQNRPSRQRCRRTWKLCLDTLLLCSPLVVVRNWYNRRRGRYPLLILTHHLVADRPHRMSMPTEEFWRQVRFLQRHYQMVSLAEAVALLRAGAVPAPTVALTFDDGYEDNFVTLRAVAEETGIPVALFIVVQPIEHHREFQHDLDRGIRGFLPLRWDQVRYWRERGGEFGSHTRTHVDCGAADQTTLEGEIIGSRRDLERHLGVPVRFFAFPFGERQNISVGAMHMAASTYSHVFSGFGGENFSTNHPGPPHLFRKKLYSSLWELELELQSVFDLVDRWRRKFRPARRSVAGSPAIAAALAASPHTSSASRAGD